MNPSKWLTRLRSQAGETLVEVLISSTLMGMVVVAIIGGIATMVFGAGMHRDQSETNAALVSAVENLKAGDRKCPVGAQTVPAYTLPANVSIKKIEYQIEDPAGTAFIWATGQANCDDNYTGPPALTDQGTPDPANPLTLQRITLKYTHPDATEVESEVEFIKGDRR